MTRQTKLHSPWDALAQYTAVELSFAEIMHDKNRAKTIGSGIHKEWFYEAS